MQVFSDLFQRKQAEELIKKDGLNFESTDSSESSLVKAAVYASSLKNNKLATLEETENARTELAAALQNYSTKPEPEKTYSVTVVQPENGSLTVSEDKAKEGDKITIIVSADDGYKLKGVKAVMEEITISAYFFCSCPVLSVIRYKNIKIFSFSTVSPLNLNFADCSGLSKIHT